MGEVLIRLMVARSENIDTDLVSKAVGMAENALSARYGGVTTYDKGRGVWVSPSGETHRDPCTVLESACIGEPFDPEHLQAIQSNLSEMLNEEAVMAYTQQVETYMYSVGDESD